MPHYYELKLRTLSPLHIGDGGVYDGMTALEHQKKFIPLDAPSLGAAFQSAGIDVRDFTGWINESKREREYRKPRIAEFIQTQFPGKTNEVIAALREHGKVELDNLSLAWINSDIFTCLKDMLGRPYVPGSEIKGAIVTAIMYDRLRNDQQFITDLRKIFDENRAFLNEAYESLKSIKTLTERKKRLGFENYRQLGVPREQQRDFRRILTMRERDLRAIRSDLERKLGYQGRRLDEICEAIEEWRTGDKRTYRNRILAEKRKYDSKKINILAAKLAQLEERYWNEHLALSPSEKDKLHKLMRFVQISDSDASARGKITNCLIIHRNPRITMDLFFEIIDTGTDFHATVTIDRNSLAWRELRFAENKTSVIDAAYLCRCLHQFAGRIIAEDLKYVDQLKDSNYRFPVKSVRAHLMELKNRNRPDRPLLRLGKGQGFLSLTLATLIRENAAEVYSKLLGVVQSDKNHPDFYPVTRRLLVDGSGNYKFPGWLEIEITEVKP